MGLAAVVLRWPPEHFWQATPHEFAAALKTHRALFCGEGESEKRRKFAIFRKGVEAADKERRWRRQLERRKRPVGRLPPGRSHRNA